MTSSKDFSLYQEHRMTFITNVGDKPCRQTTISETAYLDKVKVQVNNNLSSEIDKINRIEANFVSTILQAGVWRILGLDADNTDSRRFF